MNRHSRLALGLAALGLTALGWAGLALSQGPMPPASPAAAPSAAPAGDEEGLGGTVPGTPVTEPAKEEPRPRPSPVRPPLDPKPPATDAAGRGGAAPAGETPPALKEDALPIALPPAPASAPVLQDRLPPAPAQAVLRHGLAAIDRVKNQAVQDLVHRKIEEAVGKTVGEAVDRQGRTARPAGMPERIHHDVKVDLSQLLYVARKSREAERNTPPNPSLRNAGEFGARLALEAFTAAKPAGPSDPNVVDGRGTGTRCFTRPAQMDDSAYQRHFHPGLDRVAVPSPTPPPGEPKNFRPRGVKILIDDAVLARALRQQGTKAGLAEIEALEDALLQARDSSEAARKLEEYTRAKVALFLQATSRLHDLDHVRLVSLKTLLARLAPYRDRWDKRPDDLRTLGGLTRIHGFVRSPAGDDLFLVGCAEPGRPPIRTDHLIVGLHYVWGQGLTPACSLDPEPGNLAGPQYSRVVGVPGDSPFAKVMLDADYAMKRILLEARGEKLSVPGLQTVAALFAKSPGHFHQRFWLFPVQPGAREIQVGPEGSAALFAARVQVLTEAEADARRGLVGGAEFTGCAEAARSFTAHFEEIARQRPVFRELHGLFDVVLLARILRLTCPDDPLLEAVGNLPYEKVAVPRAYAGVTVEINAGARTISLSGGCDLRAGVGSGNLIEARSRSLDALTRAGGSRDAGRVAQDLSGAPLAVAEPLGGPAGQEEMAYQQGLRLLAQGKWAEARDQFSTALAVRDTFAAAYALRAVARWQLGERGPALDDAALAVRLDPRDVSLRATYCQLLLEDGAPRALEGLDGASRAALRDRYLARAGILAGADQAEEAERACDRALQVDPRSALACTERAALRWQRRDAAGAEADATRALKLEPRQPLAHWVRAEVRFHRQDFAGARADVDRILATEEVADFVAFRGLCRFFAGDLDGAAADALRARALDPERGASTGIGGELQLCLVTGPERARATLLPALALPPPIAAAIARAHCAEELHDDRQAVVLFERALALLRREAAHPAVRSAPLVGEALEQKLMISVGKAAALGGSEDRRAARRRIDGLAATVQGRHPDWISPYLGRAQALQHLGDFEAAAGAYDGVLALRPDADPILGPLFRNGDMSLEGFVHLHRFTLLAMRLEETAKAGTGAPAVLDQMLAALDRLAGALKEGPGRPACRALRAYFAAFHEHPEMALNPQKWIWKHPADQARLPAGLCEVLRGWAARLPATGDRPPGLLDSAVVGLFYVYALNLEAAHGNADRTEALARDFFRLSAAAEPSAPAASLFEMFSGLGRDDACQAVFFLYVRQIDKDPGWKVVRGRLTAQSSPDPAAAEAELCRAAAPWAGRAVRIGEPALIYLTKEMIRRAARDEVETAVRAAEERLHKLAEVVADPGQAQSIRAELANLTRRWRDYDATDAAVTRAGIEAAYRAARTVLEVRALDAALPLMAQVTPSRAGLYRPPASVAEIRYQINLKQLQRQSRAAPPRPAPAAGPTGMEQRMAGGFVALAAVLMFAAAAAGGLGAMVLRRRRA